jgi:hypothetical protein
MRTNTENVIDELGRSGADAKAVFGSLSVEQLNWKPAPKSWSIAQCFDHLITTHSLYFPLFERLAKGDRKQTFWESASPLSGFFGRFLIRSLRPENLKPMKTTAKAMPSSSEIGGDIIDRYAAHQEQLIRAISGVPSDVDPAKTIITSPLMRLVTYSLQDCYDLLAVHCARHFNQAKRVMENNAFPGTEAISATADSPTDDKL